MFKLIFYTLLISLFPFLVFAQNNYQLTGKIVNEKQESISGAHIFIHEKDLTTTSDKNGKFFFKNLSKGIYHIHISYIGYTYLHYCEIQVVDGNIEKTFQMVPANIQLKEVTINDSAKKELSNTSAFTKNTLNYEANHSVSLMKSIEYLPGVSSMDIGQGLSKPVIRGLSFQRIAVADNGIKQEGQQWGADHGLEIDKYKVEKITVIKGPASILYGSDAIGGVVLINSDYIPNIKSLHSDLSFNTKTVNAQYGGSLGLNYRNVKYYNNFRLSYENFDDYKVPTNEFNYNRYILPIYNNRLKNTAGSEFNFSTSHGYISDKIHSSLSISNVRAQSGFFPGAHGIPSGEKLLHDGSYSNIELPFQWVNHFKVSSNTTITRERSVLKVNAAYQINHRREWSLFHTHYPKTAPVINPDLELEFYLKTLSFNSEYKKKFGQSEFSLALDGTYQNNSIDGYMFLIPNFNRSTSGIAAFFANRINSRMILSSGLRYDFGILNTEKHISPYTQTLKSDEYSQIFNDYTWALGLTYSINEKSEFKVNLGKSFRMPNASELGANGIHHGSFRYELGDSDIDSEYAYQFDMGYNRTSKKVKIEINPFVHYFPNYIYLNPTGSYLLPSGEEVMEADAGQVFAYTQSKALRLGIDFLVSWQFHKKWQTSISGEYVNATDFTYHIPFTPPLSSNGLISYSLPDLKNYVNNQSISFYIDANAPQNWNARNEEKTKGWVILGMEYSFHWNVKKLPLSFSLKGDNLLNTNYKNHMSYYRMIELPEPGRNFSFSIKIPLTINFEPKIEKK